MRNRSFKFLLLIGMAASMILMGNSLGYAEDSDITKHANCPFCGMSRAKFAHSRMYIEYDDRTTAGVCSLHCAAIDLILNIDKSPHRIWVGDLNTKKLVDAEKAYWVIGGSKSGVMTRRAKWAFAERADAEKFLQTHGGKIAGFDQAIEAAYRDIHEDTKMIREKRKMMRMKIKNKKAGSK